MARTQSAAQRRRPWVSVHRWLGLVLGAWFALVGITGAGLVFEADIDAFLNPDMLRDGRAGPTLAPEQMFALAEQEFPVGHVDSIRIPAKPGEVYRIVVRVAPFMREGSGRVEAMFSPVTGQLLGRRDAEDWGMSRRHVVRAMYEFHRNVLLGPPGANIVGTAGLLLLTSAISGFVLASPRNRSGWKRVVGVKLRAGATRILFDVHRSFGTTLAALLLLATVTGSTLVWVNYARDLVSLFSPVAPFPTVPWRTLDGEWPTFESILQRVQSAYPERRVGEIHIPSKPTAGYLFYLQAPSDVHRRGDTIVWVHPATGEILLERSDRMRNAGETFMHWLFPLHSGTAFGMPGKIAMCLTGVAPLALVFTGVWVWLRKRRAAEIEARRRDTWRHRAQLAPEAGDSLHLL